MLDYEKFKSLLSKNKQKLITEDIFNTYMKINEDDQEQIYYRENVYTYLNVLKSGKFKMEDYFNAVKYCTYRLIGDTQKDAFIKTFPERYQRLVDNGYIDKHIAAQITAYNKSLLVTKIMEKSILPVHVVYKDMFHQSIIDEYKLAHETNSDNVKQKALAHLIDTLRPPEEATKIELDLNIEDKTKKSIVDQYQDALKMAAIEMQEMIKKGGDLKKIANIPLTKEEIIDVQED